MAKSDLLKQAIADANAVKETALANAKIALQEAFRPRMEAMFADKLSEELDDEELPADDMPVDGEGMGDEELPADEEGNGVKWTDPDISFTAGGQSYDAQIGNPMGNEEDEFSDEEDFASDEDAASEYGDEEDDLNLEGILRELEQDLEQTPEASADDLAEGDDSLHGEMDAEGNPVEDDSIDEDIDSIIEAILREEDLDVHGDVPSNETEEKLAEAEEELETKEKELQEAYKTVKKLNSIINEVNLLNAKLLYTNKLFRNFELNETQKMKVIENFDRAGNTREVKLVFSTLAESFNRPQTKKKMVKESYASKPIRTTAPSKPILDEGFELANRWKKLAGLL